MRESGQQNGDASSIDIGRRTSTSNHARGNLVENRQRKLELTHKCSGQEYRQDTVEISPRAGVRQELRAPTTRDWLCSEDVSPHDLTQISALFSARLRGALNALRRNTHVCTRGKRGEKHGGDFEGTHGVRSVCRV